MTRADRVWNLSRGYWRSNGATPRLATTATPPPPPPDMSGRLTRFRGKSIFTTVPPPPPPPAGGEFYGVGSEPWRLGAGESIYDGMPTSANLVYAHDYTNSRDLVTVLNTVAGRSTPAGAVYVQLDSGDYSINTLVNTQTSNNPNWIGWNNGNRKVMGLVGAGFTADGSEFLTRVVTSPTMVSSTAGARDYALNATTGCPITALYMSNTSTSTPLFISAISFDGAMQTPYGVFTTAAQTKFARNKTASSPLPWNGMSVWRGLSSGRMQYVRFRGFAFALNSAPPFECGAINTNYCSWTCQKVELDGRIAAYIDASRPRASGGFMWNKEQDSKLIETWQHHTRRSGMASNTNTNSFSEKYTIRKYQGTNIADVGDDGWPSDIGTLPGGFNSFNIEEVVGTFSTTDCYVTSTQGMYNWAVPFSTNGVPNVMPNAIVIKVRGVETGDTKWGGCVRIGINKTPNSSGTSPAWTAFNANFAGSAAKWLEVRRTDGVLLAPVKASLFSSLTNTPTSHYVVEGF